MFQQQEQLIDSYKKHYQEVAVRHKVSENYPKLGSYLTMLLARLDHLINPSTDENFKFFDLFYMALEVDTKLQILEIYLDMEEEENNLVTFGHLSDKEIIDAIEREYRYFYKESSGYLLNQTPPNSLIYFLEFYSSDTK